MSAHLVKAEPVSQEKVPGRGLVTTPGMLRVHTGGPSACLQELAGCELDKASTHFLVCGPSAFHLTPLPLQQQSLPLLFSVTASNEH